MPGWEVGGDKRFPTLPGIFALSGENSELPVVGIPIGDCFTSSGLFTDGLPDTGNPTGDCFTSSGLLNNEPAGEEKTDGEGFTSSGLLSKELLAGFVAAKSEFGT